MSDVERIIKAQRYQTSHVLHLLVGIVLCLLFLPVGLFYLFLIWPAIGISNYLELQALESESAAAASKAFKLIAFVAMVWGLIEVMG